MKILNFIGIIGPALFILLLPQVNILYRKPLAAILCLAAILLTCLSEKAGNQFPYLKVLGRGFLLAVSFLVLLSFFPLAGYMCQPLMLEHSPNKADAIVVLASGVSPTGQAGISGYQRVTHGTKLLKESRAPILIISTGYTRKNGHKEYNWVSSFTSLLDIPDKKVRILRSKEITTTHTEAQYVSKILAQLSAKSILLVTSGAHIYRSTKVYEKHNIVVFPAPTHNAKDVFYSKDHYLLAFNSVIHEWIGFLYYQLKGYL